MTNPETLEDSIEIEASPAQVWALVTDLPRMSEWSPQVWRTFARRPIRLGTTTMNLNRRGPLCWPTRSRVVEFRPHERFAFQVLENRSVWSFTLEPTATGTRLVQRRETPQGLSALSRGVTRAALGGQESFVAELRAGMRQTLERIRAEAARR